MTGSPSPGSPNSGPLRTGSLRRRVTWSSIGVLALVLALVVVLTDITVGALSRRELNSRITERAQLAAQLARDGVPPVRLLLRVQAPGVQAQLVTPGGEIYGQQLAPPAQGPDGTRVVHRTLPGGSRITLFGDATGINATQERLRLVLLVVGVLAIAVAATVLLVSTRLALAPLDAMTALARSIARGDRGRRLRPTRTDTELGRTAAAFDGMLDALEGTERHAKAAEARAVASEARTRQFVADAAHELRTPLAGVQAAAEASVTAGLPEPERQRLHLLLVREAQRAGRLVEDLLALARIDAGQQSRREPIELRELARAEAERVRLLSPEVAVVVDGEPITVSADAQQVSQVLANLLDNARRHATGRIDVLVARATVGAVVTVADDGPGIAPVDRERIFGRLVRLDAARAESNGQSGAGLGLAIARGFARAHGGDLRCVPPATATTGAVFRLELPARRYDATSMRTLGEGDDASTRPA
ncbi:MAG: HAMP domain-containing sensor histidine kinase [Pseudonocardiaceae bacterium]